MQLGLQHPETVTSKSIKVGTGKCFGTFGELLQGVLPETNRNFLVTFPISCYSYASFTYVPEMDDIEVIPHYKQKSKNLARILLEELGYSASGILKIESELPKGKGLASSSADLVATARAIEKCLDIKIPISQLEKAMRKIEPSDGVMYPGVVSFFHVEVKLNGVLGNIPPITIVSIDEGGEVDTIHLNKIPKPFTREECEEYQRLLDKITLAIKNKDLQTIGEVATRSAILNQKLRPKKYLDQVISICEEIGGLGVAVAHSGTYIGILLSNHDEEYSLKFEQAKQRLNEISSDVYVYQSIDFDQEEELD